MPFCCFSRIIPHLLTCGGHTCGEHTCGGQVAHRVSFLPTSRTHAAGSGCRPTHGLCFPGQGESPRLRWAIRAPGLWLHLSRARTRACTGQVVHRVFFLPASRTHARLRRASRAPCLCSTFEPRTHAVLSGCKPTHGSCFSGRGKSPGASPTHRNARKAELCSLAFQAFPLSAGGLRPKGPLKPASSQKKGEISERVQTSPFAQKRLKS